MVDMTAQKPQAGYKAEKILDALLSEDDTVSFLYSFEKIQDKHYLPLRHHFQILVYLCLHPPSAIDPLYPLSVLQQLLLHHAPADLGRIIPSIEPKGKEEPDDDHTAHVDRRSDIAKKAARAFAACPTEGVWSILWTPTIRLSSGRSYDSEEDEDDGADEAREVSAKGWEVLGWLIGVWEEDQRVLLNAGECGYSSLLLRQLPKPMMRDSRAPMDNCRAPMMVIRSAYARSDFLDHPERLRLAGRLLQLLFHCTCSSDRPPKASDFQSSANASAPTSAQPPFSGTALTWSLLTLFRVVSAGAVIHLTQSLASLSWNILSHLYTIAIEDIAGVRVARATERKKNPTKYFETDPSYGYWTPPKVDFVVRDILSLSPREPKGDEQEKMGYLKLALMGTMIKRYPPSSEAWRGFSTDQVECSSDTYGIALKATLDCCITK